MKTKLISTCLVLCVPFVLLVLCSCGGGGGDDTLLKCGNGVVDDGEDCDDGNTIDGDDCPAACLYLDVVDVCGDGVQGTTEGCDDVNTVSEDGCSSTCQVESCGDGIVQNGTYMDGSAHVEECDDGISGSATCSNVCLTITAAPEPVATEANCSDGVDGGDGDGLVDCSDPECVSDLACDADGDGILDSSDTEADDTSCADSVDNDGDGLVDSADTGCDLDQDGILNSADEDQDGDGLCGKVGSTCLVAVDPDDTKATSWFISSNLIDETSGLFFAIMTWVDISFVSGLCEAERTSWVLKETAPDLGILSTSGKDVHEFKCPAADGSASYCGACIFSEHVE